MRASHEDITVDWPRVTPLTPQPNRATSPLRPAPSIVVPPPPGPSARSANLRANRRRDTEPERRIRRVLHRFGLRFRVDFPIRDPDGHLVRPDIVFTRARIAVFVDGCFWHGCPEHGRRPTIQNGSYWGPKIVANTRRDAKHTDSLRAAGWTVLRFWEHDAPEQAAFAILKAYREAVTPPGS